MRRWLTPAHAMMAAGLVLIALESMDAEARVGGGQGFSSGRGSSSGGGGGSGGGGDGGELIYLLIRLCLYYPQIGIPLLVVVVGFYLYQQRQAGTQHQRIHVEGHARHAPSVRFDAPAGRSATAGWQRLAQEDDGLSEPVFQDFAQLVFRRAWAAVSNRQWEPLAPFVSDEARKDLADAIPGLSKVEDVVVAASPLVATRRVGGFDEIDVRFSSSRSETRHDGPAQAVYTEEVWTFRRAVGAVSLAPDAALRLGCPSCGAAVRTDPMGACGNCGTPITAGQLQWQVRSVAVPLRRPIQAPQVSMSRGGEEPGYSAPTVISADLPVQLRAFQGRHPGFDAATWERRLHHVFHALQAAWDAGRWDDARPYTTDAAWNTLRFWMTSYQRAGLRNRLADIRLVRMQVVKVSVDAWYEAVTVRFWGAMKDWTEEAGTGRLVGGNKDMDRYFSEYWTFLRAIGSGDASGDPSRCPSCGAPLDKINAAGECGYCGSVITTGRFDWVLSRIDQPEVYRG